MALLTPAHQQRTTLHILEHIPSHAPRASDPFYHYFNAAKRRMRDAGLLKCWVCGTPDDVECHHSVVEFSMTEEYDWTLLARDHAEFGIVDDETFRRFVEGEGNITPLCRLHHTGMEGIHNLPYPLWLANKYHKADTPMPAQLEVRGGLGAGEGKPLIRAEEP